MAICQDRAKVSLGYIINSKKGICVNSENIEAIRTWEPPSTIKRVRGFLGFANYYQKFIPRFLSIAQPLTDLTKKDVPFQWRNAEQKAFLYLKKLLINAFILTPFDPERETRIQPNSLRYSIEGELFQLSNNNKWKPVAYYSKKCLPAEVNYFIHDKELLAIIRYPKEWHNMLRSIKIFTILSDHKNLEYFIKKQQLMERQMRWAFEFSRFGFKIVHQPGTKTIVPDALL
jgi:hypothetical protein